MEQIIQLIDELITSAITYGILPRDDINAQMLLAKSRLRLKIEHYVQDRRIRELEEMEERDKC